MSDEEKERIAVLEAKVDMIHEDLLEIKDSNESFRKQFHSEFESHKKDDATGFGELKDSNHKADKRLSGIELKLYLIGAAIMFGVPVLIKYVLP